MLNTMAAPDPELLANLRSEVRQYAAVDDKISSFNKQLSPLRTERKLIEDRIVTIISQPAFATISSIRIASDGSHLRIKRPMTHSGSWSLSKGMLQELLNQHLGEANGQACFDFIVERIRANLVKDTYSIERT
jgi:hypothetical protein